MRVDVMPVDPAILGFSNVWYFGAHQSSLTVGAGDCPIRVLDAPHFCASKLEAFFSRGEGDLYHHDLEDFIAIVDGRSTLVQEIAASPTDLRDFLARETASLLAREAFVDALPGHLDADEASQSRLPIVLVGGVSDCATGDPASTRASSSPGATGETGEPRSGLLSPSTCSASRRGATKTPSDAREIRDALKLDERELPRVLGEGLKTKKLKSKGQKRATVYSVA